MQLDSYNCAICNHLVEETVSHLFADCSFARSCWSLIEVDIPLNESFPDLTNPIMEQLNSSFAMDAIILLCWTIWKARNSLIFRGVQMNLADCKREFIRELALLQFRIKQSQAISFSSWFQLMV
jgi:hypothetical protein